MRKALLLLLAASLFGGALALARSLRREPLPPPPILGTLPEFRLVDQDGEPFGLAELRGRPFVADFVFLGCSDVCPRLTARMKTLEGKIRLVTISVDPENDTPERLKAYARAHGADPARWTFLTGDAREVERTVVQGFKIAMGKEPVPGDDPKSGIFQIFHGEKFVLVDGQGRIRGYFDSDEEGLANLLRNARLLL